MTQTPRFACKTQHLGRVLCTDCVRTVYCARSWSRDVRFQLYVETINIWGADGFLGWASNRGPQKFQQRLQVTCVLFFITVLLKNTKDAKSSRCVYSRLLPLEKHIFLILVSMRTCCMKDWTSTSQNDQALGEQAQTDIHRNTAKNHGVFTLLAQLP